MSNNEEIIMNLDVSKIQHKIWKEEVSKLFGTKKINEDSEEMINMMKNFHKLPISETEIRQMLI